MRPKLEESFKNREPWNNAEQPEALIVDHNNMHKINYESCELINQLTEQSGYYSQI